MTQKFSTLKMLSTLIVMCLLATSFAFAQQPAKPATAKPATATSSQTAKPAAAQTETKPAQTTQSAAPAKTNLGTTKTSFQQSAAASTKVNQTANTTHEYVDLGLPSGLLWATCNVVANSPEEFGDYFAWGETKTKTVFSSGEKFEALFNKYNGKSGAVLANNEDAANANWGGVWRMPTEEEFKELNANCTLTWTSINGKNGCKVTGKNGKTVLEIIVAKSSNRPYFAPDVRGEMKAFVRCADKNVAAPRKLVHSWHYQKKPNLKSEITFDDDINFIINEIRINGRVTKEFIMYITQLSQVRVEELLAKLLVMGVIAVDIDEKRVEYVFPE